MNIWLILTISVFVLIAIAEIFYFLEDKLIEKQVAENIEKTKEEMIKKLKQEIE